MSALIMLKMISPLLGSSVFMPKYDEMEEDLNNNYNVFETVNDYFNEIDCSYIRWDSFDENYISKFYNKGGGYIEEKENISGDIFQSIYQLKDMNYNSIMKNEKCTSFCKWSSLDSSCGLIYCKGELDEKEIFSDGYTDIIRTSIDNWYYYKHIGD